MIQVNGLSNADNIKEIKKLGVDTIGFDFRLDSERLVKMMPSRAGIIPDYSQERARRMARREVAEASEDAEQCLYAGVFADDMPQSIVTRIYNYNLTYVCLYGDEEPVMIENLRRTVVPDICCNIEIVKFRRISSADDISSLSVFDGIADGLMLSFAPETIAGNVMSLYRCSLPFVVVYNDGDDAEAVKSLLAHDRCRGICVENAFETSVGVKDVELLRRFIDEIK
ncbi:MAG: phosphoribosylanthranilate isomerase [Prevotella sp.]|nr:phosphoribosylanthranilate isomerase [Prevotella sp.]